MDASIIIALLGIVAAIVVFSVLSYKGVHTYISVIVASFIVIFTSSLDPTVSFNETFWPNFNTLLNQLWWLCIGGALFGAVINLTGAGVVCGRAIMKVMGKRATLGLAIVGVVLQLCGVSIFSGALFAMLPMIFAVFKEYDIPRRFAPAIICFSVLTLACVMPGSIATHNLLTTQYYGLTLYAGGVNGMIAFLVMLFLGDWIMGKLIKKAQAAGEHFEALPGDFPAEGEESKAKEPPLWRGLSFSMSIASGIEVIASTAMSDEVKQEMYDKALAGDIICATALTEPGAGSDTRAIRTTAVRDGDEWVINGTKCFISNGSIANLFVVSAYVDKSKGAKGIAQFVVEKERGVKVGKPEEKMGLRLSETAEVIFDNIRVPMDHMVGSLFFMRPEEGKRLMAKYGGASGNAAIMDGLAIARITTMFHAIGIAQSAIDHAVKYAKERRTFGKRIGDHQGLGFMLADMQTRLDAARGLAYYAVECLDRGIPTGTLSSSTKIYVSEAVMQITLDAVQIFGGYGYMQEYPVEKLMRDAKIFSIFEGTNQINKIVTMRQLMGRDPEAK